jgi:sensor c-di-GMP phosphodiesterase-like protein
VTAAPMSGVQRKMKQALLLFVPVGLACGIVLAGAVLYLARSRLSMPAELRRAARGNEFFVEYQPVVDLSSRQWVGAEALVRWRRGSEIVRPDVFIPVAEESGVILLITERVLKLVAADLPAMLREDPHFHVSVNLSAADLALPSTLDALKKLLAASGASPANLMVEATERGFLQGAAARDTVEAIRALGVEVAIDDFGTGYSSLASLETLNLSCLKIDRSFVETIGTNGATSQVVLHIIEMAHSLNLEMIAEGIDTEDRALFLADRGVRLAQGWHFGKPMKLDRILSHLQSQKTQSTGAKSSHPKTESATRS